MKNINYPFFSTKFTMKSFIYIPEISIYIFINIKISIKRCKNVEFFTKNALQTGKCKILFKIVEKVSKYEKNNTIHNGCWRYGPEVFLVSLSGTGKENLWCPELEQYQLSWENVDLDLEMPLVSREEYKLQYSTPGTPHHPANNN